MMTNVARRVPLRTGLTYNVLEWGAQPAHTQTVVLVHGFLDHAWGWEPVAERLAARFHVIAPDLRGHGDSDRVGAGGYYHFVDYVADLAEVVRLLGRARVAIIGHSMGGGVLGYYGGTYPERLSHAAFLEGLGPPDQAMEPLRMGAWIKGWTEIGDKPIKRYASLEDAAARLQKTDPRLAPEQARRLAERGTRSLPDGGVTFKHDPLHVTTGPHGYSVANAERFWKRLTCPVLIVEGADSDFRLSGEVAARREGCFANHRKVVIDGAGHMMQRHQPDALARLLEDFVGA